MAKFVALRLHDGSIDRLKFDAANWQDALRAAGEMCRDLESDLLSICAARPVRTGDGEVFVAAAVYASPVAAAAGGVEAPPTPE